MLSVFHGTENILHGVYCGTEITKPLCTRDLHFSMLQLIVGDVGNGADNLRACTCINHRGTTSPGQYVGAVTVWHAERKSSGSSG